jgi:5-methylthioribose kinase
MSQETMTPLSEQTAIDYVRSVEALAAIVGDGPLQGTAITEGNINLIFRVANARDPLDGSVLVKQALAHSWRYPDFKMPLERQQIEYELLALEARYCPEQTPKVYLYDADNHILVVEDLNRHVMMREGLMRQQRYPLVAQHIGTFMARTLFYTSDLYLSSAEKKALLPRYINPVMRKLQEDLVFTQPYLDHPNNRWTKPLDQQVAAIHADDELRAAIFALKEAYMTHAQALLHNDLHTGSILLNQEQSKVIDPEFAFFGPIGHDIGSYLANLVIGYAAQEFHAPDPAERAAYREWLLGSFRETWRVFETTFMQLWEEEGNQEWPSPTFRARYIRRLLQDSAGFGAAEIFRRTIGLAHVQDFWTITDEQTRAAAESLALDVARSWLAHSATFTTIDDLAGIVAAARPSRNA